MKSITTPAVPFTDIKRCKKCLDSKASKCLVTIEGTSFELLEITCTGCGHAWHMYTADDKNHGWSGGFREML